jgi:hypothetical protein
LLSQAAKSGGEFVRIRGLGSATASNLRAVGDRYFFEAVPTAPNCTAPTEQYVTRVLSASFDQNNQAIQLLERPDRRSFVNHLWVGTANALFWSEGRAIYKQSIPTP